MVQKSSVQAVITQDLPRVPPWRLVPRLARLELLAAVRRAARLAGIRRPKPLPLEQLAIPDSEIARRATALARKVESPLLFNHSVRTYLFGLAIGAHLDLRVDRELLYLASVLHDLGLTPEYDGKDAFELHGARAARGFLLGEGYDPERSDAVHEAIALHTSVGIADSRAPEIALTHFGAGLDVIGVRREDVATSTVAGVVEAWPRERFKAEFPELLLDQVARKPHCHIGGIMKLGFVEMIRKAPFAE